MSPIKSFYDFYKHFLKIFMKKGKDKMKNKDSQYMMFIYGDLTEHDATIDDIAYQFIAVVTSEQLKYTYGENGIVFNFRTNYDFNDLKEYIDMVFSEITEQYFLVEIKGNLDIKMSRKLKKDFLNIDGESKKTENKNGAIDVKETKLELPKNIEPTTIRMLFPPLFGIPDMDIQQERKLSVDEILDKINESGMESLTEKEIETLNNYGKRKNGGH